MKKIFLPCLICAIITCSFLKSNGQNTKLGTNALINTTGTNNTAIGYSSMFANTSGNHNTAIGYVSLNHNTTGIHNTASGAFALYLNTTGFSNTANGFDAMYNNTAGSNNTAFGMYSLNKNTTGSNNAASGYAALYANTTAANNTANGAYSLNKTTTGAANTADGSFSLYANTTGSGNTANGASSLYNNTSGSNNTASGNSALFANTNGYSNTATGFSSLNKNTTGFGNTANGVSSLRDNNNGSNNTATGVSSLFSNSTGSYNTATGASALLANYSGYENTANGKSSLSNNNTGFRNTACGTNSLYLNSTAAYNTGVGYNALNNNTTGASNTAIGNSSLSTNKTGSNNTAIGDGADVSTNNLTNATAIGYKAIVNASNKIQLGSSTTVLATTGGVTVVSDGRFKEKVKTEDVPGLDFIKQLRPVSYNFNYQQFDGLLRKNGTATSQQDVRHAQKPGDGARDKINTPKEQQRTSGTEQEIGTDHNFQQQLIEKGKIREVGFIAQEVDKAVRDNGFTFNGVYTPQNPDDNYALNYTLFVVPLVKATQELSKMNDEKDVKIDALKKQNDDLQRQFTELKAVVLSLQQSQEKSGQINNAGITLNGGASLEQNVPNPFNHTTAISYTLPELYKSAKIVVTDKTGKIVKEANVSGAGKGSLKIDAFPLSSSAYSYSLFIDSKLVATKQMLLVK